MSRRLFVTGLRKSDRGTSSVEFALIMIPLSMVLFGSLELGYRIYAGSVVNGALRDAARLAATGGYTGTQIDAEVTNTIKSFRNDATVAIAKKSYSDFTGIGTAEPVTSGSVASGAYCYKDVNNNGAWDEDQGTSGVGGAEDVVYYEVAMSYQSLFPFAWNYLGMSPIAKVSANTMVSNEPFAAAVRTPPTERCV